MKKTSFYFIAFLFFLVKFSSSSFAQTAKMTRAETKTEAPQEKAVAPVMNNTSTTEEAPKAAIFASRKKIVDSTQVNIKKQETTVPTKSFTRKETYGK